MKFLPGQISSCIVKLGDKKRFDKEQIGVKEPFPATNLPIYFTRIRNITRYGTILERPKSSLSP